MYSSMCGARPPLRISSSVIHSMHPSVEDFSSPSKVLVRNMKTMYFELASTSAGEPSARSPMVSHSTTPHIRRFETVSPVSSRISRTVLAVMDSPASTCPPGNVSPYHGFDAFGRRCCTRIRPVAKSSIMHMLQRVLFIGCLQSFGVLILCHRLSLLPRPLGCANTRSYPSQPVQ